MNETLTELCIRLECFETDPWAADEILNHELLTNHVLEPACGPGILAKAAELRGYHVLANDIHDYGYDGHHMIEDFLSSKSLHAAVAGKEFSVYMNPPFSKAEEFIETSMNLGARKIICFQRFAFWESVGRREFWDKYPPSRVYICGDRATCWRYDLPIDEKGNRYDPITGKKLAGTSTAHAFFIFERGHKNGTQLHRLYKSRD